MGQQPKPALPKILAVSASAIALLCWFPFLIPAAIGGAVLAILLLKNKPCDPRDVRKFFDGFRIGGHRGAPKSFPENGMAGFIQAKNDGADLIEFDVALTKDGEAVLLHDDDLDRTTNLSGPIREKTLAQLARANISANFTRTTKGNLAPVQNEGIPKLEAVVKWAVENNMKMLFDVKDSDPELVKIIGDLFEKYHLYDKAIVCSFYPWVVYLIKQGNQKILSGKTLCINSLFISVLQPFRTHLASKILLIQGYREHSPRYSGMKHYIYVLIDIIHVFLLKIVTPWFLGADLLLTNNLDISK
ncbi:glycerophosphodiester phosphodiesterase family protein [Ancylostoma duodenale]|uniref:Glycerophosphodiester phosphodiesterase family protein n=1 Tax=Ancylostoma duodenale TaxID=51022 RepID=A0A0C2F1T4_9BILA|nr:glycerophosphodiester phosphodiesterase family protein [Ancylostoma duodenale]